MNNCITVVKRWTLTRMSIGAPLNVNVRSSKLIVNDMGWNQLEALSMNDRRTVLFIFVPCDPH
jgi:hypothetical protein